MLKAIRGKPRASARHGAIQMPTLTSWLASQRKQGSCHVEADDAVREAESSVYDSNRGANDASLAVVVAVPGRGAISAPPTYTLSIQAVTPNHSFNLTLCGGPILGSTSLTQNQPTTKCRLTQTLGRTFSKPCSAVGREYRKKRNAFVCRNIADHQTAALQKHAEPNAAN